MTITIGQTKEFTPAEIKEIKEQISKYFIAKKAGAKPATLVRKAEQIHISAKGYNGNDNWINKFKNGYVETNNFGKKLWFKFR